MERRHGVRYMPPLLSAPDHCTKNTHIPCHAPRSWHRPHHRCDTLPRQTAQTTRRGSMAGQRGTDGRIHEPDGSGASLKRRGILAAAGGVVAGIVARQAAQPVAALDGSLILASSMNQASGPTTVQAVSTFA